VLDLLLAAILATAPPGGPDDPVAPTAPETPVAPLPEGAHASPTAVAPAAAPGPAAALHATAAPTTAATTAANAPATADHPPAAPPPRSAGASSPAAKAPPVTPTTDDLAAPSVPPSVAVKAFLDEVGSASRDQRAIRQRNEQERIRLEKLAKEIAEARAALRVETARLEALMLKASERPPPAPVTVPAVASATAAPAPAAKPSHEALARTLKGMRPERAADLLARLDPALAVSLLGQSKPGDVAAILEKLKPEAAADLVARLASAAPVTR
jgi:flagellar motility protein MotE (MotC chaperone)